MQQVRKWNLLSQLVDLSRVLYSTYFVLKIPNTPTWLRWLIGGASASHQCGLGSIPGWGSDPDGVSEKGLTSPVRATLHPWVGTLSH